MPGASVRIALAEWICMPEMWRETRIYITEWEISMQTLQISGQCNTIRSDDYCSYAPALTDYNHEPVKYDPQGKMLHWLHIMVSNAKAFILGTYHGLPKANLSCYLAEFCFRFSRRNFGDALFDRLALAMLTSA